MQVTATLLYQMLKLSEVKYILGHFWSLQQHADGVFDQQGKTSY